MPGKLRIFSWSDTKVENGGARIWLCGVKTAWTEKQLRKLASVKLHETVFHFFYMHCNQRNSLIWMFVSVLSEDNDFVSDGSPQSPYLWLPAMPGHFVWLPEEKGYTADLLQCNQPQRQSLELHDPGASFSHILQSSSCIWVWVRVRQMLGEKKVGVGGGEESVKSYEIRP